MITDIIYIYIYVSFLSKKKLLDSMYLENAEFSLKGRKHAYFPK